MVGVGLLALIFTFIVIIWRGIVWAGILSGVFWLLLGFFFVIRTQQGVVLMEFQQYIELIFLAVGFAMLLSPFWLKAKNMDLETNAPDDLNIWGDKKGKEDKELEDTRKRSRDNIDRMKKDRRRR
jgi:hypothetical protein